MKNSLYTITILCTLSASVFSQSGVLNTFFDETDAFMKKYVKNGEVAYAGIAKDATYKKLIDAVATMQLDGQDPATIQAFYINAYNLLVIKGAVNNYPLESVLDVNGFFDKKEYQVAGSATTLNQLEKERLLKTFNDPRFHFVLVCGANGCPPITNFAYTPQRLEQQLEQQTRRAMNDPVFIKINGAQNKVEISQIFEWYSGDFGGNKAAVLNFINKYRSTPIPSAYSSSYYTYDWNLNEINKGSGDVPLNNDSKLNNDNNDNRYVVSKAIAKGSVELKLFNNLYTQRTGQGEQLTDRSTFFTSSLSFLYGVNDRFNAGFDLRYRRVANGAADSSPFAVLGRARGSTTRQGFTNFGPKIRWAPLPSLPNFSVQSAFWIPLGSDLQGNDDEPYIDWDGASWLTQFFNDFDIGSNFSLFTEVDVFLEDIGDSQDLNRFSTPVTAIFSFFPSAKTTLYVLANYSPYWQTDFDYFAQAGLGGKYQLTPNFEIEMLASTFTNQFLQSNNGNAATFNLGFRYTR